MRIRPDKQEKLFFSHLAVVTLLVLLANGPALVAGPAAAILRVMTFPINLTLEYGSWITELPPDVILDRPILAYGIALVIVPFIVINSYLWAFLLCHIKWQWRVQDSQHRESPVPDGGETSRTG